MNSFSTEWLRLREPFDARSRAPGLVRIVRDALRPVAANNPAIQVVDIGAGTGANLRYAAPLLSGSQDWLLVDHDPRLLDEAISCTEAWANSHGAQVEREGKRLSISTTGFKCRARMESLDLARELNRLIVPGKALISASALLDLASEDWLEMLAGHASSASALVWFTLIYDGRMNCHPGEPEDADVQELFNKHQRTDKGFGPALGPSAAEKAASVFSKSGYRTLCESSDWHIGPSEQAVQRILFDGYFTAAAEMDPTRIPVFESWRDRHRTHIAAGRSAMMVGHVDMVGLPPGAG